MGSGVLGGFTMTSSPLLLVLILVALLSVANSCSSSHSTNSECPEIISREEWGARPPVEESNRLPDNLPMLFVHHSAMTECSDRASCSAAVREIQDLHMDNNGWWDIGYSFLIGGDGQVYEGRGFNVQGAHTGGFNTEGYGVCFMGDFTDHNPTSAAINTFHKLAKCMVNSDKILA